METTINTPTLLQFSTDISKGITSIKTVSVIAEYNPNKNRYYAKNITIESPFATLDYKSTRLPVRRLLVENLRQELVEANPELLATQPHLRTWASGKNHRKISISKQENPTEKLLETAELIINLEKIVGGYSIRTLSRVMGVEYEHAKKWNKIIRKCNNI